MGVELQSALRKNGIADGIDIVRLHEIEIPEHMIVRGDGAQEGWLS